MVNADSIRAVGKGFAGPNKDVPARPVTLVTMGRLTPEASAKNRRIPWGGVHLAGDGVLVNHNIEIETWVFTNTAVQNRFTGGLGGRMGLSQNPINTLPRQQPISTYA